MHVNEAKLLRPSLALLPCKSKFKIFELEKTFEIPRKLKTWFGPQ